MVSKQRKRVTVVMKKKKSQPARAAPAAEVSAVGRALRALGTFGGGAAGSYFGAPAAGSAVGNSLGAAVSKWLGFGDYSVGTNSIVSKASTGIPMMHKDGQSVIIRHREFIATVRSSTGYRVQQSFQLNPGNSDTFPWLSTIAPSFQEYRFKGIVFHYIPTSGNAISGTSPSLGSVMMQTSYRANDTPPAAKAELLNEYWSGEAVPSETFAHPIECNPSENPFNIQYVRSGTLPATDNQLFYDLGVTHLCTQGQLATDNVLGDLWVTYEVELKKPIVASNVTTRTKYAALTCRGATANTEIFGPNVIASGNLAVTRTGANTLSLPVGTRGTYYATVNGAYSSFTGTTMTVSFTNATAFAIDVDGSTLLTSSLGLGSQTQAVWQFGFTVTDSSLPVTFTIAYTGATSVGTQTDVNVVKLLD